MLIPFIILSWITFTVLIIVSEMENANLREDTIKLRAKNRNLIDKYNILLKSYKDNKRDQNG